MGEEENMNEKSRQEVLKVEMESLSRNEELARVMAAVFLARLDPTVEEIDDIKTAVSEAVTNAVIHGYQNGDGIIYMEIRIRGKEAEIEIRDQGVGIPDIKKAMEPMYTTDTTGKRSGMGFSFMEAFMDELQVESQPGMGTKILMKKKIR